MMEFSGPAERHKTVAVKVGNVTVGGGAPVVVQSMTNTDTADVEGTAKQVAALARAGSEIVRITVDRDEAAAAVPHIKDKLRKMNVDVPIVGDFHYIGHKLLADHPACAEALDKYRINPGNVGFKEKKDRQFGAIVETAIKHDKPVRIGANWGSLDQELLTHLMDENAKSNHPIDARDVTREAMVQSALLSAERAEEIGLPKNRIILSAKVSAVQDLIGVYGELARRSDLRAASRPHRSRHGLEGHRCFVGRDGRAAAARHRRHHSHFADAGAERRPHAGSKGRRRNCCRPWACAPSCRWSPPVPAAAAPPRPRSRSWPPASRASSATRCRNGRRAIPGVEGLNVAVMGCIVNGPGESKHADIGISLPGTGETADRAGVHRRQEGRDPARPDSFRRLPEDGDRLYRAALRPAGRGRQRSSTPSGDDASRRHLIEVDVLQQARLPDHLVRFDPVLSRSALSHSLTNGAICAAVIFLIVPVIMAVVGYFHHEETGLRPGRRGLGRRRRAAGEKRRPGGTHRR